MTGARPPSSGGSGDSDVLVGRTLADRYRITGRLARGGMSTVYRARDVRLDRDVAVKVLAPPYGEDPEFVERFLTEARSAASVSHPSLVHVYDSGSDASAHFIVMELLDGHRTLREVLAERGPLTVAETVRIGRELLAGLRAVHARGLVHCDVKAANVMLGPGPAKLIDFGIARSPDVAAEGETSIGTLQSMSPEQLHGEPLTAASDLYSLGTVLYLALTGRMPFAGSTPEEVSAAHRSGSVPPPSALASGVPERLDAVVLQSLRRDPQARFRSAEAMDRALRSVVADAPAPPAGNDDETRLIAAVPRPVDSPSRAARPAAPRRPAVASVAPLPPRRRRGPIATTAVLGAAVVVLALVALPLLDFDANSGVPPSPSATVPASAPTTVTPNVIPDVIGRPTQEAIDMARAAGLDWTVRCAQDPGQPEGIISQEPPAGTEVAPGSRFTMYSARIADCREGDDGDGGEGSGGEGRGGEGNGGEGRGRSDD